MKKRLLIYCLFFWGIHFCSAQITFQKTFGGFATDNGNCVRQTSDGGYILSGNTISFGAGTYDFYLIKTDGNGDTLWTRTFGGANEDRSSAVRQTADGGYVLVGFSQSFGSTSRNVYLIRTDPNGDTLWTRTYGGSSLEEGSSIEQTTDGGFIILGTTGSFGAGANDIYLIKTDLNGDTLWTRALGGTMNEYAESIAQTTDGGYAIFGYTQSFGVNDFDLYLIKTDSAGFPAWSKTYGGYLTDQARSGQQTADGGYILGGFTESFGSGINDVYLVRTDANGDTLWTRAYGGSANELGLSVQQTSDSGFCIVGYTTSFNSTTAGYFVKTDAAGDTLWTKTYDGPQSDAGYSVSETADGGYIILGQSNPTPDFYLIKTDSNGGSGCTYESTPTVITRTPTQVATQVTLASSSATTVIRNPPTLIEGGSNLHTYCTTVGLNEPVLENLFSIAPNPSSGNLTVIFTREIRDGNIFVYNALGEIIYLATVFNESQKEINLQAVSAGMYFVMVIGNDKQYCTKIIIE